jgi:hypothetical protein
MVPGEEHVKIEGPLRVAMSGFDALEVRAPSVFVYLEVKFHR